jgi:mannitol-1-phosphate 5-dehydrogenase
MSKKIMIWGAGKIGRGFVAEAFDRGGYELVFVDADEKLVSRLNEEGQYTLVKAPPKDEPEILTIGGYTALHTSETVKINGLVREVPYIAVVVFPKVFPALANSLAPGIEARAASGKPLDIIICANTRGAAEAFKPHLEKELSEEARRFLSEKVGLAETVIMRVGVATPERFASYGDLTVTTSDFPYMPVDKRGFRGEFPDVPILKPMDGIEAEETRKFYTYNMVHAIYAYAGGMRGHNTVTEAAADPLVAAEVDAALDEAARALDREYGFGADEMAEWNRKVVENLTNPLLEDSLERLGKDPIRKLGHSDRLVGPARLCKWHGILPYYLSKAIARAFFYDNSEDESARRLKAMIEERGISAVLTDVAGLERDPELVSMVHEQFVRLQENPDREEDPDRVERLRTAYEKGYEYEKRYHGCAQCAMAALFDATDRTDPELFKATSAFAGGVGLSGDGICGGYAAGVLWMGHHVGRRLEHFGGDKEAQYKSFEMAQKLRDRFLETYGSVTCRHIHESIFGRAYILRTKAVRDEFEAAGGHDDRCTSVVAMASMWTTDLLMQEGYLTRQRSGHTND